MNDLRNKASALALATSVALIGASNTALAAVDVTAVETEIEGALGPIGLIGAAVLLVLVGIKVYKWVRRAM